MSEDLDRIITTLWYNVKFGFSIPRIIQELNDNYSQEILGLNKTKLLQRVRSIIKQQESHQVFAPPVRSTYNLVIPLSPMARTQLDLMDLSSENVIANRGYRWLMCFVD